MRLVPDRSLPTYTYIPGQRPHPISDPAGHSFGQRLEPSHCEPTQWQSCPEYLWGLDLFNHGYFWEAHESWEALWHGAGKTGVWADFFKALIQLAVAGVKILEGRPDGAILHARRAVELAAPLPDPCLGLPLQTLRDWADACCQDYATVPTVRLIPQRDDG